MEALKRDQTEDTPYISFDPDSNVFEISGRSLPEDASKFYDSVHEWLNKYVLNPNDSTELSMKLDYFNSASARKIVEILFILEKIQEVNKEVKVLWFYNEDDEVMEARGEEIKSVVELPFELRSV